MPVPAAMAHPQRREAEACSSFEITLSMASSALPRDCPTPTFSPSIIRSMYPLRRKSPVSDTTTISNRQMPVISPIPSTMTPPASESSTLIRESKTEQMQSQSSGNNQSRTADKQRPRFPITGQYRQHHKTTARWLP